MLLLLFVRIALNLLVSSEGDCFPGIREAGILYDLEQVQAPAYNLGPRVCGRGTG